MSYENNKPHGANNPMQTITPTPLEQGWIIAARKGWALQWRKHTKACRYGLYTNLRTHGGLVVALNLPLLGDFSLWR